MTPVELLKECQRVTLQGLERMLLTIPRKSRGRGQRVRVMPGVMGTVVGGIEDRLLIDVRVEDVVRVLERAMDQGVALQRVEQHRARVTVPVTVRPGGSDGAA